MKAIILAGGLGTRLSEETHSKPKPMVEIGGMPILWHIMKIFDFYGINEFIICCGYKGFYIKDYFNNYHLRNTDVTFDLTSNSSSIIRKNINEGSFEKVSQALGRNWFMQGKIIKGNQKARLINFPTANMKPGNHILPKNGVYCVNVIFKGNLYKGIANFGERPTIKGVNLLLETHIFEFNRDIYGKELTVEFLTFIRPEKKFKDFQSLTNQIQKDVIKAKKYHKI